jgi:hypothetical protein
VFFNTKEGIMALSVVDLYQKILPKTNCGDCGYSTCFAFASMVVSEKLPLKNCPHIDPALLESAQKELDAQYAIGKWTKKDMAADALQWAKERAASMKIMDVHERIGGRLIKDGDEDAIELPYFRDTLIIKSGTIVKTNGETLNRWEQVFIYNHMAQGGKQLPTGKWKGLVELPNTVSKMKSMKEHVEAPLIEHFKGKSRQLCAAGEAIGGKVLHDDEVKADVVLLFRPLPRIPVMLVFWDEDLEEGFEAEVKLLFDETILEHLDIESIMFLSERIKQLLCGEAV